MLQLNYTFRSILSRETLSCKQFKMATSIAWRNRLKNHKIFDFDESQKDTNSRNECKNIITIKDGEIFVWDSFNVSVRTTNLKSLIRKNESESESSVGYQVNRMNCFVQTYCLTKSVQAEILVDYLSHLTRMCILLLPLMKHAALGTCPTPYNLCCIPRIGIRSKKIVGSEKVSVDSDLCCSRSFDSLRERLKYG